ncbi:MAG: shikimate dehydrogenase [Burkholderiaceae bacterium]
MGKFVLAGVMGWPVAHSRSPAIHGHWIAQHGLTGAYVLLPVDPARLPQAVQGLAALGFAGCNVTIPHKVAAMQLVDRVDPAAQRIGAINTIVVEADGSTTGYNNDARGFIQSLREAQPGWRADAGPVAVMGCGGGARAVIVGLLEAGTREIRVCNRSLDKAQALAHEMGSGVQAVPWDERHAALAGAALLVNTTSQGMQGQSALDLSLDVLPRDALVCDLVYVPLETPLLANARRRGHHAIDGLGMLLHQARPSFHAWFGVMPEVTPQLRAMIVASL